MKRCLISILLYICFVLLSLIATTNSVQALTCTGFEDRCDKCSCDGDTCDGLADCYGTYEENDDPCSISESCNMSPNNLSCGTMDVSDPPYCDLTKFSESCTSGCHTQAYCWEYATCTGEQVDGCGYCVTPQDTSQCHGTTSCTTTDNNCIIGDGPDHGYQSCSGIYSDSGVCSCGLDCGGGCQKRYKCNGTQCVEDNNTPGTYTSSNCGGNCDTSLDCSPCNWTDIGCHQGGCASNQMYQTATNCPAGCQTTNCANASSCGSSGSPTSTPIPPTPTPPPACSVSYTFNPPVPETPDTSVAIGAAYLLNSTATSLGTYTRNPVLLQDCAVPTPGPNCTRNSCTLPAPNTAVCPVNSGAIGLHTLNFQIGSPTPLTCSPQGWQYATRKKRSWMLIFGDVHINQ